MNTSNTAAQIVKKKRKEKGLSLRELAKRSDVSYQTVFSIEHGEGSNEAVVKVLKALGMGINECMKLLMKREMRKLAAA